ncbi:uncharacterized protein LOC119906761 isoform X1 [Micropterus salmoides]|uniref:uncharacterized protein LOC119906761 isoform X1 n=2 Tax=Micropterus salmoides TaxID=27706 RepID=UPI0018EDD2BE|nr:uncharacterized protein LOC119906761 isoform X1 [Micropterus salmoides]XP_038580029.1 uncharacterized protein LOC119906761 isoform X1 [Micropterus salmoides]XP_038580031.1 uncharacterized protein LOC119906761 isoform X1 [Micropterus salmoides]
MAERRMTRQEDFLVQENNFRRNAWLIIDYMVNRSPEPSALVDEILHSIFFLGNIKAPPSFSPTEIVTDQDMLNALRHRYPQPFERYSSQVPRRCPMSCVLDMTVALNRQENERAIIDSVLNLTGQLRGSSKHLVSSTICVSQNTSDRYYGVSMSTSGPLPGKIMIAASCLSTWDSNVAGAVMTYYPNNEMNTNFDGTIRLPEQIRCQAFSLKPRENPFMPSCRSCQDLFGLTANNNINFPYGNCAEVESLSNLLKNESETVRVEHAETWTDENREQVELSVREMLTNFLTDRGFTWDNNFYTPDV